MSGFDAKKLHRDKYLWLHEDCLEVIKTIPNQSVQLILTSPPYNIGKEYEDKIDLARYLSEHENLLRECLRILKPGGSICWQVGNYVENDGEIIPLDILLYRIFKKFNFKLRNRIVWTYGHGMHMKRRFSGRYENILWFTLENEYTFNLDSVRIPQKQPTKKFYKGPRKGEISSNPLGKNPGDVWDITNVKNGHPEKIVDGHPCQFPLSLAERLIRALSNPGDIVFDPFGGVASTVVAALMQDRQAISSEINLRYHDLGIDRVNKYIATHSAPKPNRKPTLKEQSL